jgi:hypothetical protein
MAARTFPRAATVSFVGHQGRGISALAVAAGRGGCIVGNARVGGAEVTTPVGRFAALESGMFVKEQRARCRDADRRDPVVQADVVNEMRGPIASIFHAPTAGGGHPLHGGGDGKVGNRPIGRKAHEGPDEIRMSIEVAGCREGLRGDEGEAGECEKPGCNRPEFLCKQVNPPECGSRGTTAVSYQTQGRVNCCMPG